MLLLFPVADAARRQTPPPKAVEGVLVNDLPVPFNLQAVVLNRAITLNWSWQGMERQVPFTNFGFEIQRGDGQTHMVSATTYSDLDLAFGTYTYRVRVRGGTKDRGQRVTHVSDWSEPVTGTIRTSCTGAPAIAVAVQPTQRTYSAIPSLRLHLTGQATVPEGCHLEKVNYHIDSGTGILHTGLLKTDPEGRFDAFVDALGPEDEAPSGAASFEITTAAEDEAGPTTSNAYTITLQAQNKFAPRQ